MDRYTLPPNISNVTQPLGEVSQILLIKIVDWVLTVCTAPCGTLQRAQVLQLPTVPKGSGVEVHITMGWRLGQCQRGRNHSLPSLGTPLLSPRRDELLSSHASGWLIHEQLQPASQIPLFFFKGKHPVAKYFCERNKTILLKIFHLNTLRLSLILEYLSFRISLC